MLHSFSMLNIFKILQPFSMRNILKLFSTRLADQPRSHSRYPEAALSSTSLLHVHEPRSALRIVSSGSLAAFSLLRVHGCRPLRTIEFRLVRAGDAMTNQLEGCYSYLKYEQTPMFIYSDLLPSSPSSYILFLHHELPILHIFISGACFGQQVYAR